MGLTGMTAGKWRKRYREPGLEGLHDELGPGRPLTYEDDKVVEVITQGSLEVMRSSVAEQVLASPAMLVNP
jgi:transposase